MAFIMFIPTQTSSMKVSLILGWMGAKACYGMPLGWQLFVSLATISNVCLREFVLTTVIFAPGTRTYVRNGPVCPISADGLVAGDAGDEGDEFREAIF